MLKGKAATSLPTTVLSRGPSQQNTREPPSSQQRPDDFNQRQQQTFPVAGQMQQNVVMAQIPNQLQGPPSGQFIQFVGPKVAPPSFIPPGQGSSQYISSHVDYGQIPGPPQMQHRMNTIQQYSPSQNFEARAWKKMIKIKDPNSYKDVTQEILNRQPSGSVSGSASGSTGGTPTNTPDISGQSSSSNTPPPTSQQQDMRAQFAAQVAATLTSDTDKNKKPGDIIIQKPSVNNKLTVDAPKLKDVADTSKDDLSRQAEISANRTAATETKLPEQSIEKNLGAQLKEESKPGQPNKEDNQQAPKVEPTLEESAVEEIMLTASQLEGAKVEEWVRGHEADTKTASVTKNSTDVQGADASFPDLNDEPERQDGIKFTYERDFLLQFKAKPMCMLKPEGLPDLEIVLGKERTPSKSGFSQNRMQPKDVGENMFLPAYLKQNSRVAGQMQQNVVMAQIPNQLQGQPGQQSCVPNKPSFNHHQRPTRIPRHQTPNNPPLYSSPPSGQFIQFVGPKVAPPSFIPPGQGSSQYISSHADKGQIPGPPQMQYRPQQPTSGAFTPVSGPAQGPGHFGYTPQQTIYPMGQLSGPMYIIRAPAAPMNTLQQYSPSQNFEPRAWERKIIQIKDPNSNKDVTQEILNRQPSGNVSGSPSGSTGSTPTNTPDVSGQSSRSSTPPLSSRQQDRRAQFAEQVAATLSSHTDKNFELTLEGSLGEEIMLKAPQSESAEVEEGVNGHEAKAKTASVTKNSTDVQGAEASFPELDEKSKRQDGGRLTYERDFLLQFQAHPMCMLKPEGLPDLEIVLGQARTPFRSRFSQNRVQPKDVSTNMFLPTYLRKNSRQLKRTKKR